MSVNTYFRCVLNNIYCKTKGHEWSFLFSCFKVFFVFEINKKILEKSIEQGSMLISLCLHLT